MKTERISRTPEDHDLWLCLCGNTIWKSGFYPSSPDGREISDSEAKHFCCADCLRVINPETLDVVGVLTSNLSPVV